MSSINTKPGIFPKGTLAHGGALIPDFDKSEHRNRVRDAYDSRLDEATRNRFISGTATQDDIDYLTGFAYRTDSKRDYHENQRKEASRRFNKDRVAKRDISKRRQRQRGIDAKRQRSGARRATGGSGASTSTALTGSRLRLNNKLGQ